MFIEADHHEAFVQGRDIARDERVGGVHRRHALEVDVGARELRGDVFDVVGHAAQDGIHGRLRRIAAFLLVAMDFLDPFQIDHRHHADAQIHILGRINVAVNQPSSGD